MPRYALIKGGVFTELRTYDIQPQDIPHKLVAWLPCPSVSPPIYDPAAEIIIGPTYSIQETQVAEQWTKRILTAQELDADKRSAVDGINGDVFKVVLKSFLIMANDIRDIRSKLNAIIDATAIGATVSKYTTQQASQVTLDQLKTFIRNNI